MLLSSLQNHLESICWTSLLPFKMPKDHLRITEFHNTAKAATAFPACSCNTTLD